MQAPFRHTLLYDGECPLCLTSVRWLQSLDAGDGFEFLPNQAPSVGERFPHLSPASLDGALHLVGEGGEVWEGAAAVEKIVTLLPGYRWLAFIFRLPLSRPVARWVYGAVAKNRHSLNCADHCR